MLSADHHDLGHFVCGEIGQTQLDELLLAEHLVDFCERLLEWYLLRRQPCCGPVAGSAGVSHFGLRRASRRCRLCLFQAPSGTPREIGVSLLARVSFKYLLVWCRSALRAGATYQGLPVG